LAAELAEKYEPLRLPAGDDRAAFLTEHAATIRVIITFRRPGVSVGNTPDRGAQDAISPVGTRLELSA
jgi:hypothetical protein